MPRVIRVEHLSKQYLIRHQSVRDDGSLRGALTRAGRALLMAPLRPFRRRPPDPTRETFWALRDVSFDVRQGEVVGIIGRNGAGKSTLLKILSRITEPTAGRIHIRGRVASLLEVGTGFHPELTGRENIFLNGAILGMRRAEIQRKFDEIVAFAEVDKFIDTPVKRYSSGMYVRLAFGVAAHLEPEILVVDEVLAVGDAAFQKKCLGKMGSVAREGRTVLFVSHNLIALQSLCPVAIWLDAGVLRRKGHAGDVIAEYLQLQAVKTSERRWDDPATAPGNEAVRLRAISVHQQGNAGASRLARESPIDIEIELLRLVPDIRLHATLHVCVEQQVIAFTTASCQDEAWYDQPRPRGWLRCRCRIPARFLNIGLHRINLLIVQELSTVVAVVDEALVFEIEETAQRPVGAWYGKEPGVVWPVLPWVTEYLGEMPDAARASGPQTAVPVDAGDEGPG